jgi:hypothetical protein
MRRTAFAALCLSLFALGTPAVPAHAGGYRIGGYGADHVWYSTSCCYRRVVWQERGVFYARAGSPLVGRVIVVYPGPPLYVRFAEPHQRVHFSEFDAYWNDSDYGVAGCYWREAPIHAARGFWVWGRRTTCY